MMVGVHRQDAKSAKSSDRNVRHECNGSSRRDERETQMHGL